MQKVILDTNVVVSALISKGFPADIVEKVVLEENVELCLSDEVFAEYVEVLNRKKFSRFKRFHEKAQVVLAQLEKMAKKFVPSQKVDILKDLDDNKFLELALEADADFLITGNTKDFTIDELENTKIVIPKDYWEKHKP